MQSSPASRRFLPLRSKYSPQYLVPKLPQSSLSARDQDTRLYKTTGKVIVLYHIMSRDSSVGIALGYGLDDRGFRVQFPARAGNFSLHHRIQNGSGAHPAFYPMGTRGYFPGGKAAGA
jgi:hypothetical protein